ncbi:hypothetical protein [Kineococcus terrestris]|uniref:hypothetical protein n=1 Tax=Kineococcus terrestris TaxID=2044856 RepID=UPI0034DB27DA
MIEEPAAGGRDAPPPFVTRLHQVIDDAVARHSDRLSLVHRHEAGPNPYGWQWSVQLIGHPEVQAVFWYDGLDDDVMFAGDAPFGEWWPNQDEQAAQACLRQVEDQIVDLAGAGHAAAVAQAARRRYLEGRPWWRRLLWPRADERWP